MPFVRTTDVDGLIPGVASYAQRGLEEGRLRRVTGVGVPHPSTRSDFMHSKSLLGATLQVAGQALPENTKLSLGRLPAGVMAREFTKKVTCS